MKLKNTIAIFGFMVLAQMLYAQKYHILVGTYTNPNKSEGIYVLEFDSKTGDLTPKTKIAITNPSYLTISPDMKYVYAANEEPGREGTVSAFAYNAKSGELTFLNKQSSGGAAPCYVSVDPSGKHVFVANYMGGSISAIPVQADGSLGSNVQTIKHEGKSVNSRQSAPHAHSIVVSPDGKYVLSPDLGIDKINIYSFDPKNTAAPLSPAKQPFVDATTPGNGPRHLTFHPNKKFAYLIQELTGTITAFGYNNGQLTNLQTVSVLAEGATRPAAADIHVSPDGKFLYGSNRDPANDISIFSIDQKDGKLTFVGRQPSGGRTPRNFAIDPSGNWLLAANQGGNNIIVMKRDQKTGLLTPTGQKADVFSPVSLTFVPIK